MLFREFTPNSTNVDIRQTNCLQMKTDMVISPCFTTVVFLKAKVKDFLRLLMKLQPPSLQCHFKTLKVKQTTIYVK